MVFGSTSLPRIHMAAYEGDVQALRTAIADGEDVNARIDLPNQSSHTVCGVTPLYLAAQAGHKEACGLLVAAGADVLLKCAIPQSGDVFGPADIALMHFNLKTWLYLAGEQKRRSARMSRRSLFRSSSMVQPLVEHEQLAI
ncbi:hypothetical protein COO60DRAFT_1458440 [Scenedesmus sp. NREL 46B-D3]|nr:hypothetical protein COO60DRAFT_1458440 [Scenedesmus sp. NREL 46B-D3]